MRLGIVGGLGRSPPLYGRVAEARGHEALFHDGSLTGRGRRCLERLVDTCDLVVIVTDVNSHGAVQLARRLLRERGRSPLLLRRCGLARFAALLATLDARVSPAA
jgi:hypothetical protein